MPQQQGHLFGQQRQDAAPRPGHEPDVQPHAKEPDPAPVWLQRASLVVLVIFCFYIGALMTVLPWSPRYWDMNAWMLAHPVVDGILQRGWVRGVVSGVGLLDIWIGISELLHYRDYRA
ncbi:MAG: hypothetical protein PW792_16085 [Acidobacteriaceae bacterium]|nr:hypothetical protein [Acidobacteriaceae bacterium]